MTIADTLTEAQRQELEQLASPHTDKRAELEAAGWTFRRGRIDPTVHVAQYGTGARGCRMFGSTELELLRVLEWRRAA